MRAPNSSNPLHLVISAEDKADRLEACTALLPPEVAELDAQRGAVVAAAAEPAAQQEVAAAAPGSRQAVAVTAARSALRSREPSVD